MFFIIEKSKRNYFECFRKNRQSIIKYHFTLMSYKMIPYNTLNVKFSNLQLNKFKSGIKNETEVTLNFSSNIIGDDEANFQQKFILTNTQLSIIRKAFAK